MYLCKYVSIQALSCIYLHVCICSYACIHACCLCTCVSMRIYVYHFNLFIGIPHRSTVSFHIPFRYVLFLESDFKIDLSLQKDEIIVSSYLILCFTLYYILCVFLIILWFFLFVNFVLDYICLYCFVLFAFHLLCSFFFIRFLLFQLIVLACFSLPLIIISIPIVSVVSTNDRV